MIHLFKKVYLCHLAFFSDARDYWILSAEEREHPLQKINEMTLDKIAPFSQFQKTRFADSRENFWKFLFEKKADSFHIFADSQTLSLLLIQFWKSILKETDLNLHYQLYVYTLLDYSLKSNINRSPHANSLKAFKLANPFLSYEEFKTVFERTEIIPFLQSCEKADFSFELLMANYFLNKDSRWAKPFKDKLKFFAWKTWFNDIEILKTEVINSIFSVQKNIPNLTVDLDIKKPEMFEVTLFSHHYLNWIKDENFNFNNIDYVRKNYDRKIFDYFYEKLHLDYYAVDKERMKKTDSYLLGDYIMQSELVFEEKYEEYLQKDINRGRGCIFINDALTLKANHLLSSIIYDSIRKNELAKLKFLELHEE